jgi:hypothetical protein
MNVKKDEKMGPVTSCAACLLCGSRLCDFLHIDDRKCTVKPALRHKGKFYPKIGHVGPEKEKTYSSTLSLTWALDGVGG